MKTVCQKDNCTGCMACREVCPQKAIQIIDNMTVLNAVINEEKCVNCNLCKKVCQNNNMIIMTHPISWKQGWALDDIVRARSSSGGVAQAIELAFVNSGGTVCSCIFANGTFQFSFAETEEKVQKFCGSKYVKSNPYGIYKEVESKLKTGKRVLFVGLPCQVAAIKTYVNKKYQESLYTIDLICHGSPSPKILDAFLHQYNIKTRDLLSIHFRNKNNFSIQSDTKYIEQKGVLDKYSIAFLNSISYTENCYSCQYAKVERVSDLTLGDSWGSNIETKEQKKGISLILIQTEKGTRMLEMADLELMDVDKNKAIAHNHQLEHPSIKPTLREEFFYNIQKNQKFNRVVRKIYPKQCAKQFVKSIMIRLKIFLEGRIVD